MTKQTPKPGTPATINHWSDANPATISRVSDSGKTVWVKRDEFEVVSGSEHDGSATYSYSRDRWAPEMKFTLRKSGHFVAAGSGRYPYLTVGSRRRYYDPHF